MKSDHFATEAALCEAFIAWVGRTAPGVRCLAEWCDWDVLLVLPEGHQLGVQAKLRFNADVLAQAIPAAYDDGAVGPDFRAVLVGSRPASRSLEALADRLGIVVFHPETRYQDADPWTFRPVLRSVNFWTGAGEDFQAEDWNPATRHQLPETPTDSIAGSPCPVTLTRWKLGALAVLAELEVRGTITTKRMRELGVNASRWLSGRWLVPGETRGLWLRGERCPPFDQQHPSAYLAALAKARERAA